MEEYGMPERHDLELLIKSHIPIIVIETREEARAVDMIRSMQIRLALPIFRWTVTEGLQRIDLVLDPQPFNAKPGDVLGHIKSSHIHGIYVLLDFHPYLDEPTHVRLLKDIAIGYEQHQQTIVLISHAVSLPEELKNYSARFTFNLPSEADVRRIISEVAEQWAIAHRQRVQADPHAFEILVRNLSGLTHDEVRRLARTAIHNDGAITNADLPTVMKAKYALLNKEGMLHFELDTESFANLGGFARLKTWIRHRQPAFNGKLPGIDAPKGILLLGVQGCGKSLAAKAVAGVLNVPLLRLEFSSLYNKYHGETERNLRESLQAAVVMAPCVLWIDEMEKGVSVGDNDGGTSKRVLGTLLTWMAEKKAPVFVVATANDIEALPPELVRKGRFDEIFFVDLPNQASRALIYDIHLRKRHYDSRQFDLQKLAQLSEGFSGAEIEQAVVAAIYASHAQQTPLTTNHILQEIRLTKPLSVVMEERISALREWAAERTVSVEE